jgi:hypothetical protein
MRAPSCHGDPSVFSFKAKTCTGCRHFDTCVNLTHDSLLQLRPAPQIAALIERHARHKTGTAETKRALTAEEEAVAQNLPVKIAPQYRRIVSEGFVPLMQRGIAQGTNPFKPEGYKYLHVAFAQLLQGGFTKKSLRQRYMQECAWSEGTAFSAVSMVWQLFVVTGIAVDNDGSMGPNKSINNVIS